MGNEKIRLFRIGFLSIILVTICVMVAGCASTMGGRKRSQVVDDVEPVKHIEYIQILGNEDAPDTVLIQGDKRLTYTAIKQPYPLSVILYFRDTDLNLSDLIYTPESDVIDTVWASQLEEKAHTSRIEILLKKDLAYEVERDGESLKVVFDTVGADIAESTPAGEPETGDDAETVVQAPDEEKASSPVGMAATQLDSVIASKLNDEVKIRLNADGRIDDYKVFSLKNPARIVFDLLGIKSAFKKEQVIQVDEEWVSKVRYFSHPDRVRLVVDTKDAYLGAYNAKSDTEGLIINVGNIAEVTSMDSDATGEIVSAGTPETIAPSPSTVKNEKQGKAWINRIEFISEAEGKSSVLIGTTRPVTYETIQASDKTINLHLKNAGIPKYRQRPLITTRFESAVDRVTPVKNPSDGNDAIVVMALRESVPYLIEQNDNLITIRFEASSLAPHPVDDADLPSWKKVLDDALTAESEVDKALPSEENVPEPEMTAAGTDKDRSEALVAWGEKSKSYTGQKISLDFYKTDIQNVFRILQDVSGKNFAIDKDVSGKITLTLDKPVPWDQVLDLVLKMNQLGMVFEGDIIRVATLETLKAEDNLRQEALEAKQKSSEQEKALEPMITEYIPINYSNAEEDIKAHIEMILTKDRGTISVDKRTNQIIIKDVADVIEGAKEIVKRLDKVTPQVIIEARVVEASTSFARELGSNWQIMSDNVYNSDMKGYYGFDIAMNHPTESALSGVGFNFSKIVGTPYVLNATLAAMETEGQGKIISSPKIVTLDNNKATIKQGIEYPYAVVNDDEVTIQFKPIDLLLEVTPHVTMDNRISINIKITKNDIYQETSPPSLTTKEVETELLINDGETIVIGGIIKTNKRELVTGFPFLSKIPVLGLLFKSNVKSEEKEELLIFLTPSIVQLEQPHV